MSPPKVPVKSKSKATIEVNKPKTIASSEAVRRKSQGNVGGSANKTFDKEITRQIKNHVVKQVGKLLEQ